MTIQLTDDQRQAIERGEPVRVQADGIGEVVVLTATSYAEELETNADLAAWAKLSIRAASKWTEENPY
jgi:hypothetical protein